MTTPPTQAHLDGQPSRNELPPLTTLRLTDIKPYWRNPRVITSDSIEAVRKSVELYGYQQPIVVDAQHVIVVGHTRYAAMREAGVKRAEVYVIDLPEEKARQYRVMDNRTQEMSSWDYGRLMSELRTFEQTVIDGYFAGVLPGEAAVRPTATTEKEIEDATVAARSVVKAKIEPMTDIPCPSCRHEFQVKAASLPGLSQADLDELILRAKE